MPLTPARVVCAISEGSMPFSVERDSLT